MSSCAAALRITDQGIPMIEKSLNPAPAGIAATTEEPIDITVLDDEGVDLGEDDGSLEVLVSVNHDDNLAEIIPEDALVAIASDLDAEILQDLAARSDWEQAYKKGIKLLGLKNEERMEPWEGACGVVHPMITEAAVRFQAEMVTETFPAQGPVRTKILGKETPQKKEAAQRVEEDMNHQLTDVMSEFRPEHERAMWHLPIAGCVFKKVYYDPSLGRQVSLRVAAEDIILPYGTTDLMTCNRMSQFMRKTLIDIKRLQAKKFYRTVDVQESAGSVTDIQDAKDKATGVTALNDTRPELYEVIVDLDLSEWDTMAGDVKDIEVEDTDAEVVDAEEDDAIPRPYVVTFIKGTGTVLAIRRNWKENDALFLKRQHYVQYDYVPGFGAYGYGLIHLVGGYANGATSLVRQLIDAGTLSNLPGGLKTKGLRVKNEGTPIEPGEFRDVDVGSGTIKDNVMTLPYKEPSLVLSGLLDKLIEQGQRFASTADLDIGSMGANAPVGTTLAILERTLKVMSAVQARCHFSLKKELKLIAEIIRDDATEEYDFEPEVGPRRARKGDFSMVEIIPVSDPNASTMSQRVIQYQAVMQMAQTAPQVYNISMVHREMLEVIGIKNAAKLVPMPEDMKPQDPVTENMSLLTGKPVKSFITQDHEAHSAVHMMLLQDPKIQAAIGQNPQAQAIQAALMAHVAEHSAFAYRMHISQQLGMPLPDPEQPLDPEMERKLAPLLAQAAQRALMQNQQQAAQQQAQQMQQDPAFMLEQKKIEIQERGVASKELKVKGDLAIAADKLDLEKESQAARISADGLRLGHEAAARAPQPAAPNGVPA
jgi:hypothetical protein